MRVRLLGEFAVEGVTERDLGSRKGRTLLKVLAVARRTPVSVDRLADVLWGDEQPAKPADQVAVLVSRLRGVLGTDRITRSDAGYTLVPDWIDVEAVEQLAGAAADALAEGRLGAARAAADSALTLARGPLLPEEDGEWVEAERAAAKAAVTRARRLAIDAAVAAGDHTAAAALAEQGLADDPYDETILRALMGAHLAAGRPGAALAAYARARERLAEDLGVPPTAATENLHGEALAAADGDTTAVSGAMSTRAVDAHRAPDPRVVGRDAELAVLDAALRYARTGPTALVLVEGDAGIGKTTLVDAWSRAVDAAGDAVVLRGRCDELGRDLPLQPVTDALAEHLRTIGPAGAAAVLADDADALAPLLGSASGTSATVVTDAATARARVLAALVSAISRAGARVGQPVVVVVEDLHLAGAGTLEWLAFARRRLEQAVLVVTAWPGAAKGLEPTHHIPLGLLGLDAVVELVGAERAGVLHERSGGYPLLLAALAGTAADDVQQLPATVRDAVASRVDLLGDAVAATLRAAAALGTECDLDLVAQVTERPVVEVLEHLEAAGRAGLVVERGNHFAFRHDLVREALDAGTSAARRALVNQKAARVLAARPGADALGVAVHARAGGDHGLAAASFVAAARAAAARFDVDAAEQHLAAALELAPTPEAFAVRARVRMSRLDFDGAAADAEQAIASGGGAAALEVAGWVAYYRRRHGDARAYAEQAIERAGDDAVRISALALAGRLRHSAGDLAGAVEHLAAVNDGPPPVRGIADVWLAQARLHQGRPREALDALARPMVDPDALAHPWAPLHLRFNRILALGQLGRVADALEVADDLDRVVAREGEVGRRFVPASHNAAAWILRWSGRAAEADERNWRAVDFSGGDGGPSSDAFAEGHYVALLDLADGRLAEGDLDGAAALVERLAPVDTWSGTMAWHQRHRLGLQRARLAVAGGDRIRAMELAVAVGEDAEGRGALRYALLAGAVAGLADPAASLDRLGAVVDRLGRCAALDGWPLIAALAAVHESDRWRAEAERLAAAMVATVPVDHRDAASRFVDHILAVPRQ